MSAALDRRRGCIATASVNSPSRWALTVALAASACHAGVLVTAANAETQPAPAPTSTAVRGSLPSTGDESPVNRRDSQKHLAAGRARDRRDDTPSAAESNPTHSNATGRARIGVPDFSVEELGIPPFLLPIYQAAGMQYGIRWEILAAINEIETDYGRNLNISSAGALGWMQFMPATWAAYGVDANRDGDRDPFNPVDAIFAAARYLNAAGAETDIRRAVFAYNHADWYVDSVLMRAQVIGGLPGDLVGSLTGLTHGRFPVHAKATYAGRLTIKNFSRAKAPIIAVKDGRVVELGRNRRRGRFVTLQDVYGNTYTYSHLGEISSTYPAPNDRRRAERPDRDLEQWAAAEAITGLPLKQRLFANPTRPGVRAVLERSVEIDMPAKHASLGFDARDFTSKALRKGVRVIGGTIRGRLGTETANTAPYLEFEIRPAGRGARRIDPKPILDAWKLL